MPSQARPDPRVPCRIQNEKETTRILLLRHPLSAKALTGLRSSLTELVATIPLKSRRNRKSRRLLGHVPHAKKHISLVMIVSRRHRLSFILQMTHFDYLPPEARPCQRCARKGITDACVEGLRKKAKYLLDEEELGIYSPQLSTPI